MARRPGWPCAVLLTTGVLALVIGALALYARIAVLDAGAFAARATATLGQDEVVDEIASRIARREIEASPDLAARRPVLEAAIAEVVGGERFAAEFHAGALGLHAALFGGEGAAVGPPGGSGAAGPPGAPGVAAASGGEPAVTPPGGQTGGAPLALPGAGADLRAAVAGRSPAAAGELPPGDPVLLTVGGGWLEDALVGAAPAAQTASALWPLAFLAAIAALAAAAARASTRRLGLRRAALGVALAGGTLVAATSIARAIVLSTFDTSHGDAVVATIWSAFLADLRIWGLAAGALGVVAAAAFEPGAPGAWRHALAVPCGARARIARAGGLIVLAALLLWMPEVPLDLALVAGAGALMFAGAAEIVRLIHIRV